MQWIARPRRSSLRLLLGSLIVLVGLLEPLLTVSANWYAGNRRSSAYGVKAIIHTPSQAPYTASGGQYNWVGAVGDGWVQTGWKYNPYSGDTQARAYTEALTGGHYYEITPYGTQCWDCGVWYRVQYGGSSTWWAYIADTSRGGWGPLAAPAEMQAPAEVWGSSDNVLYTPFTSVQYRNSSDVWNPFDQSLWDENPPYYIESKTYTYQWVSYGP